MKWGQVDGDAAAPTVVDWLKSTLRAGQRVGADAKLVSADQWLEWTSQLGRAHPSPSAPVAPIDNHLLLQLKSKNLFPHNFHGHKNPNDMISLASVFFRDDFFVENFVTFTGSGFYKFWFYLVPPILTLRNGSLIMN